MSSLKVISSASTPLVKFLWTFKERVVIYFSLTHNMHELELIHTKHSKEVVVYLDQTLVATLDRTQISQQPRQIDVRGTNVSLSYHEGSFKLEQCSSILTATTQASGIETVLSKKAQKKDKAYFRRVQKAKAQLFQEPILLLF
jgi:hypothetical protein